MQNSSRFFFLSLLLVVTQFSSKAQDAATIRNYIDTYKDLAIAEMQRTGVPASIKLAQGIHETTAGTSVLVKKSNNHFGIKCKTGWTGESVSHTDDAPNECFRKYGQPIDSYKDHSDFLKGSPRYGSLFQLNPLDYEGWANGLKKAGYATNPKYPVIIIKLIEEYHLQDYSYTALGQMPKREQETAIVAVPPIEEIIKKETPVVVAVVPIKKEVIKEAVVDPKPETLVAIPAVQEVTVVPVKPAYPSGEFKINETRVVFAQKGTPLLALAQQYNISLSLLLDFNEMKETESLAKDQLLYLQRKRRTGTDEFHVVKPGQTLQDIAREQAIRIESLLEYNHLKSNMQPAAGEQLYLRSKAPAMPRLADASAAKLVQPVS